MRNLVALIAVAVLFLSCKNNNNPYINGETITCNAKDVPAYAVSGERMTQDLFMGRISVIDDYVLLCNLYADDSIFTVYNLDMNEPLASFGIKGQGPNDFTIVGLTRQAGVDNGNAYVWINDFNALKMKRLNVSKSIEEGKSIVDKVTPITSSAMECLRVTDSLLVMKSYEGDSFYIEKYNPISMEVFSSVPMFTTKPDGIIFTVFNTSDIYDEKNGRYISAMFHINQINFTDINTGEMYAVCVGEPTAIDEIWDEEAWDAKMRFYSDLRQTDKYLFALYTGKSVEDIDEGITDGPTEVQVFDKKESKLVAILKMDEYFDQIALDKYGRLYGADDDNIYRYELPEELL